MKCRALATLVLALCASIAPAADGPSFDAGQLVGLWAESFNTGQACDANNLHFRMELSPDGKRLQLLFDRKWVTSQGETDRMAADVLSSTPRSLVIRYDNEKRITRLQRPIEWQLIIVAPGVYRWRATDWQEGEVNTVVGIRCSK